MLESITEARETEWQFRALSESQVLVEKRLAFGVLAKMFKLDADNLEFQRELETNIAIDDMVRESDGSTMYGPVGSA